VTVGRIAPDPDATRCYVLDTSVLLSDPWSLTRFDEHEVVLPLVVISELEGKRHHPELGWFARTALRMLDELRVEHGRLDALRWPIAPRAARCTSTQTTPTRECSPRFRTDANTAAILACALNLAAERRLDGPAGEVVLVTRTSRCGTRAAASWLKADEYTAHDVVPSLDRHDRPEVTPGPT
jgi:PhoH-like ATPase